jgi:hypothetical protein
MNPVSSKVPLLGRSISEKDIPGYFTTGPETLQQLETGRSGILAATQSLEDRGAIQQALPIRPDLATLLCAEDDGLLVQTSSD